MEREKEKRMNEFGKVCLFLGSLILLAVIAVKLGEVTTTGLFVYIGFIMLLLGFIIQFWDK